MKKVFSKISFKDYFMVLQENEKAVEIYYRVVCRRKHKGGIRIDVKNIGRRQPHSEEVIKIAMECGLSVSKDKLTISIPKSRFSLIYPIKYKKTTA